MNSGVRACYRLSWGGLAGAHAWAHSPRMFRTRLGESKASVNGVESFGETHDWFEQHHYSMIRSSVVILFFASIFSGSSLLQGSFYILLSSIFPYLILKYCFSLLIFLGGAKSHAHICAPTCEDGQIGAEGWGQRAAARSGPTLQTNVATCIYIHIYIYI